MEQNNRSRGQMNQRTQRYMQSPWTDSSAGKAWGGAGAGGGGPSGRKRGTPVILSPIKAHVFTYQKHVVELKKDSFYYS